MASPTSTVASRTGPGDHRGLDLNQRALGRLHLECVFAGIRASGLASALQRGTKIMISVLIGVLIICIVGAICFWVIEKFVNDSRLASLLKLLVVVVCVGAILQRVLPLLGINWL
jgi:hypothetical protein